VRERFPEETYTNDYRRFDTQVKRALHMYEKRPIYNKRELQKRPTYMTKDASIHMSKEPYRYEKKPMYTTTTTHVLHQR